MTSPSLGNAVVLSSGTKMSYSDKKVYREIKTEGVLSVGSWHVPGELAPYDKLCEMADAGLLDTPCIERQGDDSLVYTDTDLRHRTAIEEQLITVMKATPQHKYLYWNVSEAQSLGRCYYRRPLPIPTPGNSHRRVRCLQCDAKVRTDGRKLGRCRTCLKYYPTILSGVYNGYPVKNVISIPEAERDYEGMSGQDRLLLKQVECLEVCSSCSRRTITEATFSGKCRGCFSISARFEHVTGDSDL